VGFLLNGFVFILIGLELPVIIGGLGGYSIKESIYYALLISLMVIVIRIVLVYAAVFLPRMLSKRLREGEKSPGLKLPFVIGWAGMRGVVSLASALAIPLVLNNGNEFPHRNLILFITFVVILVTLVFQGLTLPLFIKLLKVEEIDEHIPEEEQIEAIRLELGKKQIEYLDTKYVYEMEQFETIAHIKELLVTNITAAEDSLNDTDTKQNLHTIRGLQKKILLELITLRREGLNRFRLEKKYDEEVIRIMENNLDLEEARVHRY